MKRKRHHPIRQFALASIFSLTLFLARAFPGLPVPDTARAAARGDNGNSRTAAINSDSTPADATVLAQNPYEDSSQCTYRAWELAAQAGHVLPRFYDAANWSQAAADAGYTVQDTLTPNAVNAVAVWASGAGGASWAGHVAWVTAVDGDRFYVKERNWSAGEDTERWVTWEQGISFIVFPSAPPAPAAEPAAATPPATDSLAIAGIGPQGLIPQGITPQGLGAGAADMPEMPAAAPAAQPDPAPEMLDLVRAGRKALLPDRRVIISDANDILARLGLMLAQAERAG